MIKYFIAHKKTSMTTGLYKMQDGKWLSLTGWFDSEAFSYRWMSKEHLDIRTDKDYHAEISFEEAVDRLKDEPEALQVLLRDI